MYVQFRKDASAIYTIFSLIIVVYILSTCSSVYCSFFEYEQLFITPWYIVPYEQIFEVVVL
jgi:hypothetical protein